MTPEKKNDEVIGNIYFLSNDEREAILWAIRLGLRHDDGFAFPRDQNRAILRAARDRLSFPVPNHPVSGDVP